MPRPGELGVDQYRRRFVLHRLECPDRRAQSLASAEVLVAALRLHRTVPAAAHAANVTTMQRARSLSMSPRTNSVDT